MIDFPLLSVLCWVLFYKEFTGAAQQLASALYPS